MNPFDDFGDDVVGVANFLLRKRPKHAPWSLCELRLEEEQCIYLWNWLLEYGPRCAWSWLEYRFSKKEVPPRMAFGLVLMCAETEWLRRHARGSRGLWVVLWKQFGRKGDLERLFLQNGQPTSEHRHLLEETADYHRLLNIFGLEGHHNWYVSLYLQFGFTHQDFKERLPEWLSRSANLAIKTLQEEAIESGFNLAWQVLMAYRRNNCSRIQAENILKNSPWILPQWIDEVLERARDRIELDETASLEEWMEEDLQSPFLSHPQLVWDNPDQPHFALEFINLFYQELEEEYYTLWIGDKESGRLIRQEDGSYRPASLQAIQLEFSKARAVASLEPVSGADSITQEIQFWNANEEVNVFTTSGVFIEDSSRIKDRRTHPEYFLLYPDDLTPAPEALINCQPTPGYRLSRCSASAERQIILRLNGEDYWELSLEGATTTPLETGLFSVDLQRIRKDNLREIVVRVDHGYSVLRVRHRGKLYSPIETANLTFKIADPIELTPQECVQGCSIAIQLQSADSRRGWVRRRETASIIGNFWIRGDDILRFDENKDLNCFDAESSQFLFRLDGNAEERANLSKFYWNRCLIEGTHFTRRLSSKPISVGRLDGYGAPLYIIKGPYNATERGLPFVAETHDTGIIKRARQCEDDLIDISLTKPVRLGAKHVFWGVTPQAEMVKLQWDQSDIHSFWVVYLAHSILSDFAAIILTYDGVRIGSYWNKFIWSKSVASVASGDRAEKWAYLLRHGKAPLLSRHHKPAIRSFALRYPKDIIPIWEMPKPKARSDLPLQPLPDEERWKRAMGQFWGVRLIRLDSESAEQILARFSDSGAQSSSLDKSFLNCCRSISSPFLYKAIADAWREKHLAKNLRPFDRRDIARAATSTNLQRDYSDSPMERLSSRLGIHPHFISALLGKLSDLRNLNSIEKNNLKILLNDHRFRDIVTSTLMKAPLWPTNN